VEGDRRKMPPAVGGAGEKGRGKSGFLLPTHLARKVKGRLRGGKGVHAKTVNRNKEGFWGRGHRVGGGRGCSKIQNEKKGECAMLSNPGAVEDARSKAKEGKSRKRKKEKTPRGKEARGLRLHKKRIVTVDK